MTGSELGGARPYAVQMTDEAVYAYARIPSDDVYRRMGELLGNLASFPRYGQEYDPYYDASRPPAPCRVAFCGRYGIYYHVDDESHTVTVLAIEDERRDPKTRFRETS